MVDQLMPIDSTTLLPPASILAAIAADGTIAAAKVDKGSLRINVLDYSGGTSGAKAVAACAAAPAGSTVYFPPGTYVNPSGLSNGITVANDNVTLELAQGAEIQVNTWGQPGIDCVGRSGIKVIGGVVRYTGTRGDHTGNSGRSGALYTMCAGVFIDHDRCTVQGLRTINMPVGVFLSAWNGTSAYDYRGSGNRILNVEVEGADWGVLWMMQKAFVIDGLYFHDDVDDSSGANPTHAIYCSSTDTNRSYSVALSNLITENCLYGQPYQVKYADNINMSNLVARNSRGFFNAIGCVDLSLSDGTATGCLASLASPNGAITIQGVGAKRHRYTNIAIEVDQTGGVDQRNALFYADDSTVDGLTIVSKRTSSGTAGQAIVEFRGLNHTIRNLNITETSAYAPVAVAFGTSSVTTTGVLVDGVRIAGCLRGFDLYDVSGGVIRYSSGMVALSSSYTSVRSGTPDFAVYEDGVQMVTGTPEGAVTAPVGKLATRRDATAGRSLYLKETGSGNTGWRPVPKSPDVQAFTSGGTWTMPADAVTVEGVVIGGGGGGGSGRRGAAGTIRSGGAGGGGGGLTRFSLPASAVGSSVGVTVGAGGTAGAAVTTNDTSGNAGGNGGTSAFGSLARAAGGTGGAGGTAAGGAGGAGGWGTAQGSAGGTSSSTGAVGVGSQQSGGPSSGASGGGITSADVASNGAGGLGPASVTLSGPTGGVVDSTAPGTATSASAGVPLPGGGGGGGAGSITTTAQTGAAGGLYGGGGSGGGASLNGNNSGAGGAGAAGIVVITTYF